MGNSLSDSKDLLIPFFGNFASKLPARWGGITNPLIST